MWFLHCRVGVCKQSTDTWTEYNSIVNVVDTELEMRPCGEQA